VTSVSALAIAAWTLTTGASYSLVSHLAHTGPITAVQTTRPEVGVLVDAPITQVPSVADELAGDGIHVTFGLARPSLVAEHSIFSDGDRAIPELSGGGLVRWLETGDQLRRLCQPLGFHHHFVYASTGPSIGQWWLARHAGGRLVAGAVLLDDRDDITRLHAGEVVEVRVSPRSHVIALVDELRRQLTTDGLTGVPVSRLMRDAGVAV
jgi:hypothetical protein